MPCSCWITRLPACLACLQASLRLAVVLLLADMRASLSFTKSTTGLECSLSPPPSPAARPAHALDVALDLRLGHALALAARRLCKVLEGGGPQVVHAGAAHPASAQLVRRLLDGDAQRLLHACMHAPSRQRARLTRERVRSASCGLSINTHSRGARAMHACMRQACCGNACASWQRGWCTQGWPAGGTVQDGGAVVCASMRPHAVLAVMNWCMSEPE